MVCQRQFAACWCCYNNIIVLLLNYLQFHWIFTWKIYIYNEKMMNISSTWEARNVCFISLRLQSLNSFLWQSRKNSIYIHLRQCESIQSQETRYFINYLLLNFFEKLTDNFFFFYLVETKNIFQEYVIFLTYINYIW